MRHKEDGDNKELSNLILKMRTAIRIAVVYAGSKDGCKQNYNYRSWKSYKQVATDIQTSLLNLGFTNIFLLKEDINLGHNLYKNNIDLVWLNSAGVQGHDAICHGAAVLESLGIDYIGQLPSISALLDNKYLSKVFFKGAGIRVAEYFLWNNTKSIEDIANKLKFDHTQYIAKPINGRASQYIRFIRNQNEAVKTIKEIYALTHNDILIEEYLPGREFCISILGHIQAKVLSHNAINIKKYSSPIVFLHERILTPTEKVFSSMDEVPISSERIRCVDKDKNKYLYAELNNIASQITKNIKINSIVRADVRCDKAGKLHLLEINPKPDIACPLNDGTGSIISLGLKEINLSYNELILSILANRLASIFKFSPQKYSHLF